MRIIELSIKPFYLENRNVNIGWAQAGMGDADYLYAFTRIILPIAYEFAPELVISAFFVSISILHSLWLTSDLEFTRCLLVLLSLLAH